MTIENTLKERGARYGDFTEHARICQNIKYVMGGTEGWERLNNAQKQALEVIADKVARILNGDPNYIDNWHDIIGYAKLVEDRLVAEQVPVRDVKKEDPGLRAGQEALDGFMNGAAIKLVDPVEVGSFEIDLSDPVSRKRGIKKLQEIIFAATAAAECGCPTCVAERARNGH